MHSADIEKLKNSLREKLNSIVKTSSESDDKVHVGRAARLAYSQFESFVTELLQRYVLKISGMADNRADMLQGNSFDFVSQVPIQGLAAPIGFEVKFATHRKNLLSLAKSVVHSFAESSRGSIGSVVLVTNWDPKEHDLNALKKWITVYAPSSEDLKEKCFWWGPSKLAEIASELGVEGQELIQSLPVIGLHAAIRKANSGEVADWAARRPLQISRLHKAWTDDELVFFLGAGVSIDASVPAWDKLIATLYAKLVADISDSGAKMDKKKVVQAIMALQGGTPLMNARILRSGLGEKFLETVREALYADVQPTASEQLSAVARLCDPPRGRIGARAVVSYNFDDLLEQALQKLNVAHLSIFAENSRPSRNQLPVYHVHGFIPQPSQDLPDQNLVFSEEGYHLAYNNPYTWSNIIQLNLLTQHTCVFVGLSMIDPNLRRLLEIANAARSEPRHVALLRREKAMNESEESAVALGMYHSAWETTLNELGVHILWYTEYSEIAEILSSIRIGSV